MSIQKIRKRVPGWKVFRQLKEELRCNGCAVSGESGYATDPPELCDICNGRGVPPIPFCELGGFKTRLNMNDGQRRDRIRDCVLDKGFFTLNEIADLTGDPPASISAQLRRLRQPQFGSYAVNKRRIGSTGAWEYEVRERPK